jgi:4-amino-4-deoxy-L-arabinose transferase-like glycosyltransferase
LLALGLVGVLAIGWGFWTAGWVRGLPRRASSFRIAHLAPQQAALVLWGIWTLTMVVFFSIAGFFHRYYLPMLAPGIAALAGIGLVLLWRGSTHQPAVCYHFASLVASFMIFSTQ